MIYAPKKNQRTELFRSKNTFVFLQLYEQVLLNNGFS